MGCSSSNSRGPKGSFWQNYDIINKLGSGMSCSVYKAKEKKTGRLVAVKQLSRTDANTNADEQKRMFETEVGILKTLSNPACLEFICDGQDERNFYIATVLCEGGELFDRVKDYNTFTERTAASLAKQMLEAVSYLHTKNIAHRDLKPENFVFEAPASDQKRGLKMRLIDFGCAIKRSSDDGAVEDYAGSPYYVAPEVLCEKARTLGIWKACDMWSLGVIVYLLLYGVPPFFHSEPRQVYTLIKRGKYRLPNNGLSKNARNFIKSCLIYNPRKRITAAKALTHPFITSSTDNKIDSSVRESLQTFQKQSKLKKAVARMIAKHMTEADRKVVNDAFKDADKNKDGRLDAEEIATVLKSIGKTDAEIKKTMDEMDADHDGGVDEKEFAEMHAAGILGKHSEDVAETFKLFDRNGDGSVDMQELSKWCEFMDADKIREALKEADQNQDGKISFDEWAAAMKFVKGPGGK